MHRYRTQTLLLLIAAWLPLSACTSIDKMLGERRPQARIVGASLPKLDGQSAEILLDVEVENPYGIDIPVVGLDFGLASGGRTFLSGALTDQGSIPARNSRVIPVNAKIPFVEALRVLSNVRPGAVVPYEAQIGLKLDVPTLGAYRIPLNHSGEFPIPAVPRLSVDKLQWESFGLTGAVANVAFKLGNANQFPVSVDKLAYDFELAGKRVFRGGLQKPLKLDAGQNGTFNLRLELSAIELGMATWRLLGGSKADYGFNGDASLGSRFGDIRLPVQSAGQTDMNR